MHDIILSMDGRIVSPNSVLSRRQLRRWSQAELARRAGISRAAVSAIEGDRLSPSVTAALALASVLECSVEELFGRPKAGVEAAGPQWAWTPRGESCRYWQARIHDGRRIYPVEAVGLNAIPHDGLWHNGVLREAGPSAADRTLVMASCDPAAGLLAAEYARESGFRLLVFPRGGHAALELLRQNLVHIAGLHHATSEHPGRNAALAQAQTGFECRLLRLARWDAGIALAPGDRCRSAQSLVRRHLRWAARERGSAARECLDELLGQRRFSGREVNGHAAVAEAVRSGWANAGVCVKFSAAEAGLNFVPLRAEALDLCFPATLQNDPRMQALVQLVRNRAYRQFLGELPGYDARETGELVPVPVPLPVPAPAPSPAAAT